MGGLFSCFREPENVKKVRNVQVLSVGEADGFTQKTDYGVFCVSNTHSVKKSSNTCKGSDVTDLLTKPSTSAEGNKLEGKEDLSQKMEAPKSLGVQKVNGENVKTMLQKEGLVTNLKGLSSKGLAFEIVEKKREDVVPPARLREMIRRKEKRTEPTVEEIRQKLFEAERRRKQLADERIIKVRAMKKTEPACVIKAFEQKQMALEDQQTKRMDDAVASRQKHLRGIRDKLREKRRHANLVRQLKDLDLDEMDPPSAEEPRLRFHPN